SPVINGKEVAETVVALDNLHDIDLFPIAEYEINTGMLDHIDWLVFPDGIAKRYEASYGGKIEFFKRFIFRGGKMAAWGKGVKYLPQGGKACDSGEDLVEFFKTESLKR
ncbi:MAG: hypothetical protein J6R18_10495, partial [Kiritimatiellae bacterium]|nr:hypothetical protein [Kiritimatiellia bacterium]